MGMKGLAIMKPCVRGTSLEEGWKSETIGSQGSVIVEENLIIK